MNHEETIKKGFIPELSDVVDLIWIEHGLTHSDLSATTRTALEALEKKAIAGDSLTAFLASLRRLRKRAVVLLPFPCLRTSTGSATMAQASSVAK